MLSIIIVDVKLTVILVCLGEILMLVQLTPLYIKLFTFLNLTFYTIFYCNVVALASHFSQHFNCLLSSNY